MDGQLALSFPEEDGERWLPVPGYDGWYDVSDRGRVRSWRNGRHGRRRCPRVLRLGISEGYPYTSLTDGVRKVSHVRVHTMVLEAFVGPRPAGLIGRHLNDIRTDCRLDNLKWGTWLENTEDVYRNGILPRAVAADPGPIMFADPFIPLEALIPWEVWKEIDGWPGYDVSNKGRVRSWRGKGYQGIPLAEPFFLKQKKVYANSNHRGVTLGGRLKPKVHRLVIEAFSPQPSADVECRHVDGNGGNNGIGNLRWGTRRENVRDRILHGTLPRPGMKLSDEDAKEVLRRIAGGEMASDLARQYRVSDRLISMIYRGRIRRHITRHDGLSLAEKMASAAT